MERAPGLRAGRRAQRSRRFRPWIWFALGGWLVLWPQGGLAFPPYRSTDAETAEAGTLEARLGLVRLEREGSDNEYSAPLARLNFGLLENLELIAEFEHPTRDERSDEVAFGFKWVPRSRVLSLGVETLMMPPLSARHAGIGVESQAVLTWRRGRLRAHLNGGAFYDSRPAEDERGWRGSILVEEQLGRVRLGVEVFAKKVRSEPLRAQLGPGVIVGIGRFDVRAGLHVGLTSEAPDLMASLWISRKWSAQRR